MSDPLIATRGRRSMRMVWKTLRLRHVGLAFFWACSMLTFRSSILLAGPANTPGYETFVVLVSFVANMTTLFAMAAFMERNPSVIDRLPGKLFCACIIAGIVALASAGRAGNEGAMIVLLAGGGALTGIGYGYYWGSWAECLGRMHPSRTSFYIPAAFLVSAALFLVISFAAELAGVPPLALMVPLPVLSLACLHRCRDEAPDGGHASATTSKRYLSALGSLVTLIVASLVLSLLFGFVWEMTVLSVGSVNEAHQIPLVADLAVAVGLIGLVLYANKRMDLALAYRVIVPIIVVLFAVMPFFWETNPVVLNVVMSASYGVFDVIIWYMVASTAYDYAVSGFVVGGIVRALSILARLVGIGIGYLLMLIPGTPSMLIVGVSTGGVYVLAMLGLFYVARKKSEGATTAGSPAKRIESAADASKPQTAPPHARPETSGFQASPALNSPSSDQAIYDMIAEDFSLTRRESEVLPYLARGRSAKVIAEALFVSENTIRTHTRRILEKTELHSKQQIIDLIETYR